MYEILIEKRAERDLRKFTSPVFYKLIGAIKSLAENPRPTGCSKLVGSISDWRIRVGNYRILYEIDDSRQEIRIMSVSHRREAYRDR